MIAPALGVATWPAAMFVWGPGFVSTPHHHPCMQLTLTLRGSLRIRGGPGTAWRRCGAALVRPNAVHEIDARGTPVLLAYVHAESALGATLGELVAGDITCPGPALAARWRASLGSPVRGTRVDQWVRNDLLNGGPPVMIDGRVRRVLTYVRQHIGTSRDFSLTALAAFAGLSRSRFMHLFSETLGAPLRPYLRWLRVQRAACELLGGTRISTAAHRAGFADAAHLNRTFRRMLGMTPREIVYHARQSHGLNVGR
jgi:AraC-like DNA-binding protein